MLQSHAERHIENYEAPYADILFWDMFNF